MTGRIDCRIEQRGESRVAHLTIDNRARLNTLNTELMEAFCASMQKLHREDGLRAVVLRGAGEKAFIGGADINEMVALDRNSARDFITLLHECCAAPSRLPLPVIARLAGYTLGGGLELAAGCDLRVAGESARFGMPEVRIGIPSVIEAALLPRLIGKGRATRLVMTGEIIPARTALDWGLVEEVVPEEELDPAIDRLLDAILAAGPRALSAQKRLIGSWDDMPPEAAIADSIEVFAASWDSDEPGRMMARFLAEQRRRKGGP